MFVNVRMFVFALSDSNVTVMSSPWINRQNFHTVAMTVPKIPSVLHKFFKKKRTIWVNTSLWQNESVVNENASLKSYTTPHPV